VTWRTTLAGLAPCIQGVWNWSPEALDCASQWLDCHFDFRSLDILFGPGVRESRRNQFQRH
jgi:hypothetical protein